MTWSGPVHLNNYLKLSPVTDEDIKTCIQLKPQKDPHGKAQISNHSVTIPWLTLDIRLY